MNIISHTYTDKEGKRITSYDEGGKIKEVILHCSATPEGMDFTVETINKWHLNRGFTHGIGYNYIIYRDGSVHRGRPEGTIGAHTVGHNRVSIGICYIGGCNESGKVAKDTRTEAQKRSMYELVDILLTKYKLPLSAVHGHRDFAAKACPSFTSETFRKEFLAWKK